MCGRSSLSKTEKELEERFQSSFYSDDLERYNPLPNFNVAPTHMHPVLTNEDPAHFQFFRWGLIPFWAKNEKIGYRMINARVETILEKNSYKTAFRKRRCLVPFDGFYEWAKTEKGKQPYRIGVKDWDVFSIAGIWESWESPQAGTIHSFSLITQPAADKISHIHDRMPAILLREQESLWLDNALQAEDLLSLIHPYPDEMLDFYPVSTRVNKVAENDESLIEKIELDYGPQTLF